MSKVVIEALFPEFCNLYGDSGNLLYLKKKLCASGCEVEILRTGLYDLPAFVSNPTVDLLYIGPCTESQQLLLLEQLRPHRAALHERMNSGKLTLATGNSFELFGQKIICADEKQTELPALGFWDTVATRFSRLRYNELCMGEWNGQTIVGFKNQLSHSTGTTLAPFLQMKTGSGLNPESTLEGCAWKDSFFATYLIGPILPLNPDFTAFFIRKLAPDCEPVELPFERVAYQARVKEFSNPAVNHSKKH